MAFCPFHDNKVTPALQVNVRKGLYVCFSCGARGSVEGASSIVEASEVLAMLNGLAHPRSKHEPSMPEESLARYMGNDEYWIGRGFDIETIERFQLGFDTINNAAVIPVRDEYGVLRGTILRYMNHDDGPKYKNPRGFERRRSFFGAWLVGEHDDTAVLVEGPVDAMRVWQAGHCGLALYGTRFTDEQRRLLSRLGIKHVVLFLDNDRAGKIARRELLGTRTRQDGRVDYDTDKDLRSDHLVSEVWKYTASDPGAMSIADVQEAIDSATSAM